MLVLTRKAKESIVFRVDKPIEVGTEILVEFHKISHGRLKAVIQAPIEVRVLRGELCNSNPQPASSSNHTVCSTVQPEAKKPA